MVHELIFNNWYSEEKPDGTGIAFPACLTRTKTSHVFKTCPAYTGQFNQKSRKFKKISKVYSDLMCVNCKKGTRHYCQCDPTSAMCLKCFALHKVGLW